MASTPSLLGELAHAERPDAVPVGQGDGGVEDPLPAQWGLGGHRGPSV